MKELLQDFDHLKEEDVKKSQQFWRIMELPELSLAPTSCEIDKSTNSSSSESETYTCKKRKFFPSDDHRLFKSAHHMHESIIQTSVDLQLQHPLPLDWEQCLDLESGRMYYLNRKTSIKTWNRPSDRQKLDLELNISAHTEQYGETFHHETKKQETSSDNSNMVALACLNCHLLVILSKSSPSCPNCKFVHSLPPQQIQQSKTMDTLSLLI